MKLTSEREQEIREMIKHLSAYSVIPELLNEIDALRKEKANLYLDLIAHTEHNGFLEETNNEIKEILINLLKVSRECANDYEYEEKGYYYWVEKAKEVIK
jgi:hypothetical protein